MKKMFFVFSLLVSILLVSRSNAISSVVCEDARAVVEMNKDFEVEFSCEMHGNNMNVSLLLYRKNDEKRDLVDEVVIEDVVLGEENRVLLEGLGGSPVGLAFVLQTANDALVISTQVVEGAVSLVNNPTAVVSDAVNNPTGLVGGAVVGDVVGTAEGVVDDVAGDVIDTVEGTVGDAAGGVVDQVTGTLPIPDVGGLLG